jgi:hypothetical protein
MVQNTCYPDWDRERNAKGEKRHQEARIERKNSSLIGGNGVPTTIQVSTQSTLK